jgi:hypothetical protein
LKSFEILYDKFWNDLIIERFRKLHRALVNDELPLPEAKLVEEMSENVQLVFISHNKATMEIAKQLAGVTMRESGVSRMVSVDIDEALDLVES